MDTTIKPENIAQTLSRELPKPIEIASRDFDHCSRIALPPGWKTEQLDDERLLAAPRRKTASVTVADVDSFCAYLQRHSAPNATVWASANYVSGNVAFLAVLNDHGGEEDGQDWRDHRASFIPEKSTEWTRWKEKDRQPFSQVDFAAFVEDNLADVVGGDDGPSGADMLRMAIEFEANQDMRFKSAIRLQSGGIDMAFTAQDDAGTLQKMRLFDRFSIGVPVFWGGEAYRIDARLRYRVREGKLSFWYELVRADKVVAAATLKIVERVREFGGAELFFGQPFVA